MVKASPQCRLRATIVCLCDLHIYALYVHLKLKEFHTWNRIEWSNLLHSVDTPITTSCNTPLWLSVFSSSWELFFADDDYDGCNDNYDGNFDDNHNKNDKKNFPLPMSPLRRGNSFLPSVSRGVYTCIQLYVYGISRDRKLNIHSNS